MGPALFLVPLGVIALLVGAAQAQKKKAAATAAGTSAAGYQLPSNSSTITQQVPADVQAMIAAAVNSGNPETQRRVAATIKSQYPAQAQYLETVAAQLDPILAQWGASTLAEAQQKEAQQAAVQAAQQAAAQQAAQGAPPVQQVAAAQTAAAQTIQAATASQASQPPLVVPSTAGGSSPYGAVMTGGAIYPQSQQSTAVSTPGFVPPLPAASVPPGSAVPSATTTQPPLTNPTPAAVAQAMAAPVQALQAAQTAGTAALAAGATLPQAILAAQNAATMATNPAVNAAVQSTAATTMPQPPMAAPVTAATPPANAGKQLAADLAKALKTAKKGTSSEPKALVQAFQTQEKLAKTDGSYGYETALALADRYGIVPTKPMYWGEKGGAYDLVAKQKQAYSAHLLALATQDPQRADEWKAAAKV